MKIKAAELTDLLYEKFYFKYNTFIKIVSDKDSVFTNAY